MALDLEFDDENEWWFCLLGSLLDLLRDPEFDECFLDEKGLRPKN